MDANKLSKLKEIKYSVKQCCALCIFAILEPDGWGVCGLNDYNHEKHTESLRRLSITEYGSCEDWKLNPNSVNNLGAYKEFLEDY